MSKPFYNIMFCIFACDTIERYKKEIKKIKETWGKNNLLKLNYFCIFFFIKNCIIHVYIK